MNKLKIGYFADGPWAHQAFELLIKDENIEIVFIVPRIDTTDQNLQKLSTKFNIDYLEGVKVNSDDFYKKSKSYNCDLFVSMSYNQIFKSRIMNLPPLKTINCHAGKLPFYRGRNIINWALINDEKEFGITVHYIDEGIDTGDIILQKVFKISQDDTYASLLQLAHSECGNILYDAINLILNKKVTPIKQNTIHPTGFYCGIRGPGDEIINWQQTSKDIFNFIRSISQPGPISTTFLNGNEVKINKATIIDDVPKYKGTCGQIIGKTDNGFLVKTLDTFIEISSITTVETLKVGMKLL